MTLTIGKFLLTVVAVATSAGPYLADFNETHVKNPRWPPHAKFHNGQTMSMGLCLGLLTAYYTWRSSPDKKDSLFTAAVFGSLYYLAGLSAILYPGTKWCDPEFPHDPTQPVIFGGLFALAWLGYHLERLSVGRVKVN